MTAEMMDCRVKPDNDEEGNVKCGLLSLRHF
jgi:hypothetical protein